MFDMELSEYNWEQDISKLEEKLINIDRLLDNGIEAENSINDFWKSVDAVEKQYGIDEAEDFEEWLLDTTRTGSYEEAYISFASK